MGLVEFGFELQRSLTESLGGTAVSGVLPRGITSFEGRGGQQMRCIYATDSSLITMFEIYGTRHFFNSDMIAESLDAISKAIKSVMKNSGHTLQISMHYDRKRSPALISQLMDPMSRASQSLGIDIQNISDDWSGVLAKWTAGERICVALWTHPNALVPAIIKEERKRNKVAMVGTGQQNPTTVITAMQAEHATSVSNLVTAFRAADLVFEQLTPEDAAQAMRLMFDEEWTSPHWQPWNQNNDTKTMPSLPSLQYDNIGGSWIMPESLANQIVPREAVVIDDEFVRIGSRTHYPFMCKLMPQQILGFRFGFFSEAIRETFPWRITWTLRGGQRADRLNSALARILHFFSGQNRKINSAYEYMKEYSESGDGTPVSVQVSFDTWVDSPTLTREDIALLRKQQAQFAGIVQAWGTQETINMTGDAYPVLISSIPGLNWRTPAPATLAPLEEVFQLFPLMDRAASPWKTGIPFRTPDGKLFPYAPMSTNQAAWITFGVAPMGSGKSVLANVENFAFIFNPDLPDIPYLYIIDVGPSSSGLIRMIQETLPPDKRHYACEFTLNNSVTDAINVFDTELGCRRPFQAHRDFLVNLLTLMATPVSAKEPHDGVQAFARACVDAAYRTCSESKVKLYQPGVLKDIDEWIENENLKIDDNVTWWEITDKLFLNNKPTLASKAQRYAVPILLDVANEALNDTIRNPYMGISVVGNERLPDYFYRHILEAINNYPVLSAPTRFDIGDAKIASIDLDRFKSPGAEGSKVMAIMFMVAQQVMAGRFYQDYTDIHGVEDEDRPIFPKKYKEVYQKYHEERIKNIKELPKRLSMDEVHRITTNGGVVAQQFVSDICTRARESRKWGVSFAFWTQMYEDIPPEIVELTTTLYVLGIGTAKGADEIVKTYGMAPEMADAIYRLPPPGPQGSSMMALYRTKEGKPYYHILTLTVGLYMLWALSSTKNERIIRDELSKEFGFGKALDILVYLYPRDISKIIEQRQQDAAREGSGRDILREIIDECKKFGHSDKFKELIKKE